MERMAILDLSSCFFTTLQESLRIQKESILGIMGKDWSTTFKFLLPCRNELLCSKTAHLDRYLSGRPSQVICSRIFKTMATPRPRKDQDNSCMRFLAIEDI